MPMPDYNNYVMNQDVNNQEISPDYCLPLNPTTGAFVPRAYVIDQPYVGILPYAEGLRKGTIFPNIILPALRY